MRLTVMGRDEQNRPTRAEIGLGEGAEAAGPALAAEILRTRRIPEARWIGPNGSVTNTQAFENVTSVLVDWEGR